MRARQQTRLGQLSQRLAAQPLREGLVEAEFHKFVETGELPEEQRLAAEVVQLAISGGPRAPMTAASTRELLARLPEIVHALEAAADEADAARAAGTKPSRPARHVLFDEAVRGEGLVRAAARLVLQTAAQHGADLASFEFLADQEVPDHVSLGLHLLGFPECLARPPYVAQAKRLFARFDALQPRIDRGGPGWFGPIERAVLDFRCTGELPEDDLVRDCALAEAEFNALFHLVCGEGDAEVLAAFDEAAGADGEQRAIALERLRELARQGRLLPAQE
ncbi:MAG: hypothetical protein HZB39_18655 [Planctomycetes bacterium]|nr:hypothetical protein [Planctomycetota bacterium]